MFNFLSYEILKLMGWATVILVSLSLSFHLLLRLNKILARRKSSNLLVLKLQKFIRYLMPFIHSYHKTFGITAFLTGIIHGSLLIRSLEIHSGYITWSFILLLGLTGIIMKVSSKRIHYQQIRKIHTLLMYVTLVLMIFHIIKMK